MLLLLKKRVLEVKISDPAIFSGLRSETAARCTRPTIGPVVLSCSRWWEIHVTWGHINTTIVALLSAQCSMNYSSLKTFRISISQVELIGSKNAAISSADFSDYLAF